MAGDHKCPVCSSTFTRPQHVARHMRSHTGDRPYKCSHCGDQFARSDLLSRHVNKCHASEKPPTTTQPAARRRGHAQPGSSASGVRGPAPPLIPPPGSRKICDACSVSRTPAQCDGGFPCGKCMQRNSECLYIKANASRRAAPITAPELFAPPTTVPSMAPPRSSTDGLYPPSQSAFNFTVPLYPSALDSSAAVGNSSTYNFDQSGNQGSHGAISAFTTDHPVAHTATHHSALNLPYTYPHAGSGATSDVRGGSAHPALSSKNALLDAYLDSAFPPPPGASYLYGNNNTGGMSSLLGGGIHNAALGGHQHQQHPHQGHQHQHPQQMPPLLPVHTQIDYALLSRHRQQQASQHQSQHQHSSTENSPTPPQQGPPPQQDQQTQSSTATSSTATKDKPSTNDRGVSFAFGAMSLDDPNISAEMAREQSFFAPGALPGNMSMLPAQPTLSSGLTPSVERTNAAGGSSGLRLGMCSTTAGLLTPNMGLEGGGGFSGGTGLTPFGEGLGTGLTPGKDLDSSGLMKDFFKAFMRSPGEKSPEPGDALEGGTENKDANTKPNPDGSRNGNLNANSSSISDGSRPSFQHRPLSKISSLPDIKTPGGGSAFGHLAAYNQYNNNASRELHANTRQNFSDREDLRSYERAVLARQAPTLTLPKPRAGSLGSAASKDGRMSRLTPPQLDSTASSPASTSSVTSSQHHHQQHQDQDPTPVQTQHQPLPNQNVHTNSLAMRRSSRTERPTFKRLASSTLAPFESKSAKTSHNPLDDHDDDPEWADGVNHASMPPPQGHSPHQQPSSQGSDQGSYGGHARHPSAEYPPYGTQAQHHGRRLSAPSSARGLTLFS